MSIHPCTSQSPFRSVQALSHFQQSIFKSFFVVILQFAIQVFSGFIVVCYFRLFSDTLENEVERSLQIRIRNGIDSKIVLSLFNCITWALRKKNFDIIYRFHEGTFKTRFIDVKQALIFI